MDTCLLNQAALSFLPSRLRRQSGDGGGGVFSLPSMRKVQYRSMVVVATAGQSRCEPGSSLNAPLELRSAQGRFLRSVLLNKRQLFHYAAADELKQLADEREAALARMALSSGSDEASLHRSVSVYLFWFTTSLIIRRLGYIYTETCEKSLDTCVHAVFVSNT